ncbi:uncharacterized protein LOC134529565 isoform X2 [Bacillus rossius redtenbacheri]|uniref:uncharacterized protein LOC134529565 isoform X2 n=1 Tax=Bacillus rossius redtenbacheri TaxID=93214 RepID=UPI002FDE080C
MAPWPEKGNEPKAPDKFGQIDDSLTPDVPKVNLGLPTNVDVSVSASRSDEKQNEDKNSGVSNLDDGQLKALLDEAITYKCPKDREGKSNLFRELLQEVEADDSKDEDTHRGNLIRSNDIGSCRYITGSRRKNKRDGGISERQTKGGSLQNLVQAFSSEFDGATNLGYFTSGHACGGGRRRSKKNSCNRDGVSVSARQREGGSLPSNVNVGGVHGSGLLTLTGLELTPRSYLHPDESKTCCSKTAMSIKRKDKTNHCSLHLPNDDLSASVQTTTSPLGDDVACHSLSKNDIMVIELGDFSVSDDSNRNVPEQSGVSNHYNEIGKDGELQMNQEKELSGDIMGDDICCTSGKLGDDESVETEVIKNHDARMQVNYTTLATLEVSNDRLQECNGDVDSSIRFPFPQGDRDDRVQYGVDVNPLQLTTSYNSVKCVLGSSSTSSAYAASPSTSTSIREPDRSIKGTGSELYRKAPSSDTTKTSMIHPNVYPTHHLSVLSIPPNHTWITSLGPTGEGRLTFHGSKEMDSKCKSLDENGNSVSQACRLEVIGNNERKSKQRRAKIFNDRNVIMSQNIEGHRGDKDIDSLIKFIESDTDGKGRHKHTSHNSGPLPLSSKQQRSSAKKDDLGSIKSKRDGIHDDERGCKSRIQGVKHMAKDKCSEKNKLKKSNSLEEISKSKIEDLMSFTSADSNVAVSVVNVKNAKRSHLDNNFVAINKKYDSSRELCSDDNHSLFTPTSTSVDQYFSPAITFSEGKRWRSSEEKNKAYRSPSKEESATTSVQVEEMEFHVVTKKQRRKKRSGSSGGKSGISLFDMPKRNGTSYMGHVSKDFLSHQTQKGSGFLPHDHMVNSSEVSGVLYQYRHHRPRSPEHQRRKSTSSMPPSEKSDSSDLDSVHSLPVSSTTPRLALDKTSTSSGSTPQASYADIARMAATNIVPVTGTCCSNLNSSKLPSVNSSKMTGLVCSGGLSGSIVPAVPAGSKNTIGTLPVSASKVVFVGNVTDPVSFSEETLPFDFSLETDKSGNQQNEMGKKKDAMTNTTLDYKLISHNCIEDSVRSDNCELSQASVLNDYYPSLEESLFVDKCDRKSGKISNTSFPARLLVDNVNVPISSLVKKYVDIVCTDQTSVVDVHAVNSENTSSTNVTVDSESSVKKTSKTTGASDTKDNEMDLERQLSLQLCIQESVFKIKSDGDNIAPTEDCSFKAANYAQSVKLRSKTKAIPKAKNNRILSYSSGRPPVILMNESLREGLAFDSDLTFGFEVNEQLLLSNGEEELCENAAFLISEKPSSRENNATVEELPQSKFSIEKFLARFQKPNAQVTDDKIVNFVGYAWNDVMKEVNSADGKVQYYTGQ